MNERLGEGGRRQHSLSSCENKAITGIISRVLCVFVCVRACMHVHVCVKDEIKSRSPSWLLDLPLVSFGLSPCSSYCMSVTCVFIYVCVCCYLYEKSFHIQIAKLIRNESIEECFSKHRCFFKKTHTHAHVFPPL